MANPPSNMPAPPTPGGFPPPGGHSAGSLSYGVPVNKAESNSTSPQASIPPQPTAIPQPVPPRPISTSSATPPLTPSTQTFSQPAIAYGSNSKTPPPGGGGTNQLTSGSMVPGLPVGEVHTMPEKFLPNRSTKAGLNSVKKFALVGGVIVVVMVIITAVVVLIFSRQEVTTNQNTALVNIVNVNRTNTNTVNTNISSNLNTNLNSNASVNAVANANQVNSNANSNTNLNTNTNSTNTNASNGDITSTKDTDKDGLTDNEEAIWSSGQNKPDTDGDGFLDGEEIAHGFSPTSSAKLTDDPNAKLFQNSTYQYSILYPARWVEGQLNNSDEDILLTAETGEFVEVTVTSNPKQQTAKQWYADQFPDLPAKELATFVTTSGLNGVKSQDGLTGYLATTDTIYLITYNIGTRSTANFLTTFNMMLTSFQLVP